MIEFIYLLDDKVGLEDIVKKYEEEIQKLR